VNFRNIMLLVGVAVVITTAAGLLSPDPEIRKMAAMSLIDDGKVLMGAAIGILGPQIRSIAGGERSTDTRWPGNPPDAPKPAPSHAATKPDTKGTP
jgi:hypothetical protein